MELKISVIICTIGRDSLYVAVQSVLQNNYSNYELIVISQKNNLVNIPWLKHKRIRYYFLDNVGQTKARNFGIDVCSGDIIAFTDDDCVVSKNWLSNIVKTFEKYPSASMVFGSVLPFEPHKNHKRICPCVISHKKTTILTHPTYHASEIGFGNNMCLKKDSINEFGFFKNWLGPGTISHSADDAEMALRLLAHSKSIVVSPSIKIWHNRWHPVNDYLINIKPTYDMAELACYTYFILKTINSNFKKSFMIAIYLNGIFDLHKLLKRMIRKRKILRFEWTVYLKSCYFKFKGFLIGLFFGLFTK